MLFDVFDCRFQLLQRFLNCPCRTIFWSIEVHLFILGGPIIFPNRDFHPRSIYLNFLSATNPSFGTSPSVDI